MSHLESSAPEPNTRNQYTPTPGSKLDIVLGGLDPRFALSALTESQREGVVDKGRARRVMELRFGLEDGNAHTLKEVGRQFGIARERVRIIEVESLIALNKTRKMHRPERVFERRDMFGIDDAYRHTRSALRRMAERDREEGIIRKPRYEYPE